MPKELARIPDQATLIHILGVLPCDFDTHWSEEAEKILQTLIERPLVAGEKWRARVRVAISRALVVDSVYVVQYEPDTEMEVVRDSLKDNLMKGNAIVSNGKHFENLERLCCNGGLRIPAVPGRVRLS